jgi:hypothetical protein
MCVLLLLLLLQVVQQRHGGLCGAASGSTKRCATMGPC